MNNLILKKKINKEDLFLKIYITLLTILGFLGLYKAILVQEVLETVAIGMVMIYGVLIEICFMIHKREGEKKYVIKKIKRPIKKEQE